MGERVRKSFKEGDDRGRGGDVGGRSTRAERSDVDVATVGYNQNILESVDRTDGKATGEVGGRPVFSGDGRVPAEPSDRPGWERGVDGEGQDARAGARGERGDGAKNGIRA